MSTNVFNPADRRHYPERWPRYRGKQLFEEIDDRSENGEEELLSVSHITGITPRSQKNVTMFKAESLVGYKRCQVGDIAANTMWTWQGAIGVSRYAGVVSPAYNVYRQRGDFYNPRFLDLLLREPSLVDVYHSLSTGIRPSRLRLYPKDFLTIDFPVPPRDEQDQIVRYLDWKNSEINALINSRQALLSSLADLKKSLITFAACRGMKSPSQLKDSGVYWLGDIPKNWNTVTLKRVIELRSENGIFNPKQNNASYIGLENVVGYSNQLVQTDSSYEESTQSVCHEGDILFGKLRPYLAKVIIAPRTSCCSSEFLDIKAFDGDMRYLRYLMLSKPFLDQVNSSTYGAKMPRANAAFIISLDIPYPPIEEQHVIADRLDSFIETLDCFVSTSSMQISGLRGLRRSLNAQAVSGSKDLRIVEVPDFQLTEDNAGPDLQSQLDSFSADDFED